MINDSTAVLNNFEKSLSNPGYEDRSGRSDYDRAVEALVRAVREDDLTTYLDGLLEIARVHLDESKAWWLRYLVVFEEVGSIKLHDRMKLMNFFVANAPTDVGAQAISLRTLAILGCHLDWSALARKYDRPSLEAKEPLTLADALVWSEHFNEAASLIRQKLSSHAGLSEMKKRWRKRLGGDEARRFFAKIEPEYAFEGEFEAAARFVQDLRSESPFFQMEGEYAAA